MHPTTAHILNDEIIKANIKRGVIQELCEFRENNKCLLWVTCTNGIVIWKKSSRVVNVGIDHEIWGIILLAEIDLFQRRVYKLKRFFSENKEIEHIPYKNNSSITAFFNSDWDRL